MKHKISDLKIGDQIIILNEERWTGSNSAGKIGKITEITHNKAITDICDSFGYKFVNDTRWPFRLAPNGI